MIQKYSHIFFDIDGVLISSIKYYAEVFKRVAEELGAEKGIPFHEYCKMLGVPAATALEAYVARENRGKIQELFDFYNQEALDISHFPVVDGAEHTLRHVKKNNKKIALVSTKSRAGVDFLLKSLAWETLVDYSVSGDCVANLKPHPEPLIKALEYFQVDSKNALFIGDSFHDLHSARAAGVDFFGVLSGVCEEVDWKREGVEYFESVKVLF